MPFRLGEFLEANLLPEYHDARREGELIDEELKGVDSAVQGYTQSEEFAAWQKKRAAILDAARRGSVSGTDLAANLGGIDTNANNAIANMQFNADIQKNLARIRKAENAKLQQAALYQGIGQRIGDVVKVGGQVAGAIATGGGSALMATNVVNAVAGNPMVMPQQEPVTQGNYSSGDAAPPMRGNFNGQVIQFRGAAWVWDGMKWTKQFNPGTGVRWTGGTGVM
jgi:hypothetical protein